ncbi:hypothetical protein [Nocardioides sp. KR10-350]|uniref:hypothetical protein n=1 Tax=Nocardioides cheoyonin TaxID=3156615 RepID=UPI0032B36668
MSTIGWIIVAIIVAIIVIAALIAGVVAARKRRREQRAAQAAELRSAALEQRPDLSAARHGTAESEANAKLARAEGDRAEEEAARSRRALDQEEATHEDRLREADRLDPAVDDEADDYQPGANLSQGEAGTEGRTYATGAGRGTRPPDGATPTTDGPTPGAHRRD